MVSAVIRYRSHYDIAYVEVYSGQAFAWAEATSIFLRRLKKPHVLCLHGGGLPNFTHRWLWASTALALPSKSGDHSFAKNSRATGIRCDLTSSISPMLSTYAIILSVYVASPIPYFLLATRFSQYLRSRNSNSNAGVPGQRIFPKASLTMIGPDNFDGPHCRLPAI